ncbi:hypothetical protein HPB48_018680 [Haemaphysalis longicornis]|uniref:Uncharacterized protein n=1 Tax=Haemaphysalis longicornis TaxID=44386 RepID=A0A9J6GEP9_HAELO|nr:hypothetical protein HPB48_018680 [Haemaphysalis longicornis]
MSATGNAAGNATCNASVNASDSAAGSAAENRAPPEEQEEERAAPCSAMIVHPEHEFADLIPSQDLRQDIMDRDEYYNLMRMANAEHHELLREIIHRQTTATFVLRLAMDINNRYINTGNNTAYNAFVICGEHRESGCASGRNHGCTRLSSSLGRLPAPQQGRRPPAPAS